MDEILVQTSFRPNSLLYKKGVHKLDDKLKQSDFYMHMHISKNKRKSTANSPSRGTFHARLVEATE